MDPKMRAAAVAAGLLALVLAVLYGPVLAGYVFAGAAFGVIFFLMALEGVHAIDDWRLDHPLRLRRHHARTGTR